MEFHNLDLVMVIMAQNGIESQNKNGIESHFIVCLDFNGWILCYQWWQGVVLSMVIDKHDQIHISLY